MCVGLLCARVCVCARARACVCVLAKDTHHEPPLRVRPGATNGPFFKARKCKKLQTQQIQNWIVSPKSNVVRVFCAGRAGAVGVQLAVRPQPSGLSKKGAVSVSCYPLARVCSEEHRRIRARRPARLARAHANLIGQLRACQLGRHQHSTRAHPLVPFRHAHTRHHNSKPWTR